MYEQALSPTQTITLAAQSDFYSHMHHTRIVHEIGFFQLSFPFPFIGFDHREFVRRLTEWKLSLPAFNLVGTCEVIARVFRYRPARWFRRLLASRGFVVGHDSVCPLIVDFFTSVLAAEMGISLRRRSRFCQVPAVKRDETSSSIASCNNPFKIARNHAYQMSCGTFSRLRV